LRYFNTDQGALYRRSLCVALRLIRNEDSRYNISLGLLLSNIIISATSHNYNGEKMKLDQSINILVLVKHRYYCLGVALIDFTKAAFLDFTHAGSLAVVPTVERIEHKLYLLVHKTFVGLATDYLIFDT